MKGQAAGPALSAVFVDYDNIYLSLKRKNDEAAKRFAKDAALWLSEIASGSLITPTNTLASVANRRIVMSRCYGNPVPRRNNHDNSTDMNSFPFVRHHFLRAGFEAIDCPPLTAQLKNSADIRMVMDVRDYLLHDTYFEEFIILSGDADFTPLLHRLRAHARRTVIFANDNTAAPYTAIADGEIRESSLISLLLDGRLSGEAEPNNAPQLAPIRSTANVEAWGKDIIAEVVETVRTATQPVPLEALADKAVRSLGHERTAGSGWGGAGSFRELLAKGLPADIRLSAEPPYFVYDVSRQIAAQPPREQRLEIREEPHEAMSPAITPPPLLSNPMPVAPALRPQPQMAAPAPAIEAAPTPLPPRQPIAAAPAPRSPAPQPASLAQPQPIAQRTVPTQAPAAYEPPARPAVAAQPQPAPRSSNPAETQTAMQQSIARIYEACQAPPLSPIEYRALFDCMAQEIAANGLTGAQTLSNIVQRAREIGVEVRRDDVRFVLEVVSEADPWFEQGASTALFAGRFRNFVVARCRGQGLNLSLDELDLIESWFTVPNAAQRAPAPAYARAPQAASPAAQQTVAPQPRMQQAAPAPQAPVQAPRQEGNDRWWSLDEARTQVAEARGAASYDEPEEFPRIVKNRLRG